MRSTPMFGVRIAMLGATLFALGVAPADTGGAPCVLGRETLPGQSCAPFTVVPARLLHAFSQADVIGNSRNSIEQIVALADGSVVALSFRDLYRIQGDKVQPLWSGRPVWPRPHVWYWTSGATPTPFAATPKPYSGNVYLLGAFDNTAVIQFGGDWIYGIAADGHVPLRFYFAGSDMDDRPSFAGRDTDGTLWFESGSKRYERDTIYALYPNGTLFPSTIQAKRAFQGSNGSVYATSDSATIELRSLPYVHTLVFTAWKQARFTDSNFYRHQVGADGSLWSSTSISVTHRHPDGRVVELNLYGGLMTISHIPIPLDIQSSPDGSVWAALSTRLIRITNDDRIEVMSVPDLERPELRIAGDGSVWISNGSSIRHYAPPMQAP